MKKTLKDITNTYKYLLVIFYPLFISILLEYNICQNINSTFTFLLSKPNILLFNIILSSLLFIIVFLLFKKSYISIIIHGLIFYILSCIEYFKYKTSGSHLVISDLLMTKNISDVGKFASLKITYPLILNFILLLLFIYLTYRNNLTVEFSLKNRLLFSTTLCAILITIIATPVSNHIFSIFNIETDVATNILESNEQFDDIGFLPYLTKTTNESLLESVITPDNYNENTINTILSNNSESATDTSSTEKPNVIFIMSESFSDFRVFDSLNISEDIYNDFDEIGNEGYVGHTVVPTFGGYTTRTEFELLLGLPAYALDTPSIPQNLLRKQNEIKSIPSYFKSLGYNTTYIHPFSKTFYDRDELYPEYGFDNLYFNDNITVEPELFRKYISDKSVFEQIKEVLKTNQDPSYIFTTTMQNHQPYYEDDANGVDQLSYYLDGIKETNTQLREFTNWLKSFDEDVILVFVGDHFPFFTPDDDIYDRVGLNENNAQLIYNQKYIIWNNYNLDLISDDVPTISSFYIPYLLIDVLNTEITPFIQTMENTMKEYPLYSPSIQSSENRNEILDLLTYDRVLGEMYSK